MFELKHFERAFSLGVSTAKYAGSFSRLLRKLLNHCTRTGVLATLKQLWALLLPRIKIELIDLQLITVSQAKTEVPQFAPKKYTKVVFLTNQRWSEPGLFGQTDMLSQRHRTKLWYLDFPWFVKYTHLGLINITLRYLYTLLIHITLVEKNSRTKKWYELTMGNQRIIQKVSNKTSAWFQPLTTIASLDQLLCSNSINQEVLPHWY